MCNMFKFVPPTTVMWTNDDDVYEFLTRLKVGKEVKICGKDGWPEHGDDCMLVRLTNVPPPVPVSTFMRGEIVLNWVDALAAGGV